MKFFRKFCLLSAILASSNVLAANQWCTGKISNMYVHSSGSVVIYSSWRGNHTAICSIKDEWEGISVDVCKGWMSLIQTALVTKNDMTINYNIEETCSTLPTYGSSPAPGYVMLKE